MSLFKERLKSVVMGTLLAIFSGGLIVIVFWAVTSFLPRLLEIAVALVILLAVGYFINWLFIEPFRKGG